MEMNLIQEFASYMRNVKNRSELTISAYCSDLAQFCAIMHEKQSFGDITRKDIETLYIENLVEKNVSAASRARKLSSLKAFYKWAKTNGYVVENPVESVESPKIPHKEPKVMSREEVQEVMFYARNDNSCEENLFRDNAIMAVLFNTGLRRAEVVNLKLCDVDLQNSSLLVHGKGNKERIVYYNSNVQAILSEYIHSHRKLFCTAAKSEYLFISKKSVKLNVSTINLIVDRNLKKANIKDNGYTAHSTRKVFATQCYSNSRDIVAVKELLGHSSTEVTMRYIGISESMKKQAAQEVNF